MTQPAGFHKSVVTVTPKQPEVSSVSVTCCDTPTDSLMVSDLSWPNIYITFKSDSSLARGSVLVPRAQMLEFCRAIIMAIENTPVDMECSLSFQAGGGTLKVFVDQ